MRNFRNRKMIKLLLLIAQIVILLGLTAASFYLLYRYAEYGVSTSGSGGTKETETDTEEQLLSGADTDISIRVQILGDNYQGEFHQKVRVFSENGFVIRCGEQEEVIPAGEVREMTAEELRQEYSSFPMLTLTPQNGGTLVFPELARAEEEPEYGGSMELYIGEGGIVLVNEIGLEEYLCGVVSSEMPSDYPQEALRAQAVCGRTYALQCMALEKNQNFGADLDDSVSFQVYNNYQKNDATVAAVLATAGEILNCGQVLYYSTSCQTEGRTDLGTEEAFQEFLAEEPDAEAEYGSPWVRWSVTLSGGDILERLKELYGCIWDDVERIEIKTRNPDGQIQEAVFSCGDDQITAEGEYAVRQVLSPGEAALLLHDGTVVKELQLLPSAYFYLCKSLDGWEIRGGGYGHGQGMSQYGAAAMAAAGADYREILAYYYG